MHRAKIINHAIRPEAKIQKEIRAFLELRGWYVRVLHGNIFQTGMPDLFICRRSLGWRFVEVKQPVKYIFTESQCDSFPKFAANDVGIWILTAAIEQQYNLLFKPANWWAAFHPEKMRSAKGPPRMAPEAKGPEAEIQRSIIRALESDGWFVKVIHCDVYQVGMPDIFACKRGAGIRWIEVKNPKGYRFTGGQYETFPRLASEGVGVWILTSDSEIKKLSGPPNWHEFMYEK